MKANESHPNFRSKLKECSNYCVREIRTICKEHPGRGSGYPAERAAQERMAGELRKFSDDVRIEEFTLHPAAFMSWVIIAGICLIGAVLLYNFVSPLAALILSVIPAACVVFEFLLYKQFLDPLFPKKTSANVVAVRKPEGEVKRRIVFSGHCDAAYEWTYTRLGGSVLLKLVIYAGFAGLLFTLVCSLAAVISGRLFEAPEGVLKILGYIQFAWLPIFFAVLFFTNWKRVVEGANDNLTGSMASVAVMKYLADHEIRFADTEVCAVLTGSEEAGLRGAKAYAKQHKDACMTVETAFIGLETFRDLAHMAIYSRDMSGLVKNDPRVCALLKKAGEYAGIELPYQNVYVGASDAAAISQAGIPAATLASMDPAPARYYHTRLDTADNMDPKAITAGLQIALEAAFLMAEQGLKENYTD